MMTRKIGIVGSGNIGGTLGVLLGRAGYEVLFSSRHPEQLKDLATVAGPKARAGTVGEAVAFGDVVIMSLPLVAMPELGSDVKAALKGKPVLVHAQVVKVKIEQAVIKQAQREEHHQPLDQVPVELAAVSARLEAFG